MQLQWVFHSYARYCICIIRAGHIINDLQTACSPKLMMSRPGAERAREGGHWITTASRGTAGCVLDETINKTKKKLKLHVFFIVVCCGVLLMFRCHNQYFLVYIRRTSKV